MTSRTQKLTWAAAWLLAAGAAAAWAIHAGLFSSHSEIKAGDEILSVQPENVVSLEFDGEEFAMAAHRVGTEGGFRVRIVEHGKSVDCDVGASLGGALATFATIRAVRMVNGTDFEKLYPHRIGTLTLRDSIDREPIPSVQFRGATGMSQVVSKVNEVTIETTIARNDFSLFHELCR